MSFTTGKVEGLVGQNALLYVWWMRKGTSSGVFHREGLVFSALSD